MWHISKEKLILFPLVPFLYHVCQAWPSTLPLKMRMSNSLFFLQVLQFGSTRHCQTMQWCGCRDCHMPRDHFRFWKFEQQLRYSQLLLWSSGSLGCIWHELMDVWAIIWLWWGNTGHAPSLSGTKGLRVPRSCACARIMIFCTGPLWKSCVRPCSWGLLENSWAFFFFFWGGGHWSQPDILTAVVP